MHDPCFSSESEPTYPLPDEVVDCAIIVPSPFLSEGAISMEDEPPVDAPQVMIDEPHPPVNKLQVLCVPYTPSFEKSLGEIQLFEYDGSYRGKKGKESMKRRYTHVESTCTTSRSLCSRRRMLKKERFELWTVHSERFKLLLCYKV